jgi:hypothetical protein
MKGGDDSSEASRDLLTHQNRLLQASNGHARPIVRDIPSIFLIKANARAFHS